MGYQTLLKEQIQGLMKTLGQEDGLAPAHTYIATDSAASQYDPATGTMIAVTTSYPNVPMVLTRFKIDEMDNVVIPVTDMKVLIASLDLPVTPFIQDRIQLDDGTAYMVERLLGVPGASLHILHVRKTA